MQNKIILAPLLAALLSGCGVQETFDALESNRQAIEMSTQAIQENRRAIEAANQKIEENRRQLDEINQALKKASEG